MLLTNIIAVLVGFGALIWGAERFVLGASATARNLGVSPLIIGLTVVGFGTSAPEMLVSGIAAWYGTPGISIGNALGSNIANIGLVLGFTALVSPIIVSSDILRREFPLLFLSLIFALLLIFDGEMSRLDGYLLLGGMVLILYWIVRIGLRSRQKDPMRTEFEAEMQEEIPAEMSNAKAFFWLFLGALVLLAASRAVVWGATDIARALGVSDLVIGLTVIAIGTSLPELAASIMCVLKKEYDIAIGNVVGSNMFNILAVMGIPGAIGTFIIPADALSRDYGVMFVFTVGLFVMSYGLKGPGRINRIEGGILFSGYIAYMVFVYLASV